MGCHYCDSWAGRSLGEKVVCEDCYQTVKAVPDEDRVGVLTERLQKVHGLLIKQEQKGYVKQWRDKIASRLHFLSGVEVASGPYISQPVVPVIPIPLNPPEVVTKAVAPKAKKLIIKKFR